MKMLICCFVAFWGCWLDPPSDTGTVIIYRRRDYFTSAFTIKINQRIVTTSFSNNEYIEVVVPEGKIFIETSGSYITEKQNYTLTVKAGETYFLKGVVDYDFYQNTLYLSLINPTEAIKVLSKLERNVKALRKLE
jgi:hypothetical protein